MMDSKDFIIDVLTNKVDMEDYSKKITANFNGFEVTIKKDSVRRGCTVFVSHPFLDMQCIFKYYYAQKKRELRLDFSGIVDAEYVDALIQKANRIFPNDVNVKGQESIVVIKIFINRQTLILADIIASLPKGDILYYRKNNLVAHHLLYNKYLNFSFALILIPRSEHNRLHSQLINGKAFEIIPYMKKSKEEMLAECISIFFSNEKIYRQVKMNVESRLRNANYLPFVHYVEPKLL